MNDLPVAVGFGKGDDPIMVSNQEELDAALDELDRRAREADDVIIALLGTDIETMMTIGVGSNLVPVTYGYVRSRGSLPEGEPEEWRFMNTWNEISPTELVPAELAREAARQWLVTGERPDNLVWTT